MFRGSLRVVILSFLAIAVLSSCTQPAQDGSTRSLVAGSRALESMQIKCTNQVSNSGAKIIILGDSVLDRGGDCQYRFESYLATYLDTKNITNLSRSDGGIVSMDYPTKSIFTKYDPSVDWDYILVSGGFHDYKNCFDATCLDQATKRMSSSVLSFVKQNRIDPQKLIFVYPTSGSTRMPKQVSNIMKLGGGAYFRAFYQSLVETLPGSAFADLGGIVGPYDSKSWDRDGYHYTAEGYKKIASTLIASGYFSRM